MAKSWITEKQRNNACLRQSACHDKLEAYDTSYKITRVATGMSKSKTLVILSAKNEEKSEVE